MDRETFFRALMAALIAFLLWTLIFPPATPPAPPAPVVTTTPQEDTPVATLPAGAELRGAEVEESIELGGFDGESSNTYPVLIRLSNRGAGLASADLAHYYAKVRSEEQHYRLLRPLGENGRRLSLVTASINLNERDHYDLSERLWSFNKTVEPDREQAVFWLDLAEKDQEPFARLTKTYTVGKQERSNGHSDITLTLRFENFSPEPIQLIMNQMGPLGLAKEDPRSDNRKATAAVRQAGSLVVESELTGGLKQRSELFDADTAAAGELTWAALGNKFFAVIMAPAEVDGGTRWIGEFAAVPLPGQSPEEHDATFELVTRAATVPAGGVLERSFDCYLGPKSKKLFTSDPTYSARQYVELINDDYYICAWAPIVNVLLFLLNLSYSIVPNYGLAIIVLVLIVRTILHPLTKKGQVNMTRMSSQMAQLQPKMEEIRKKHGNDQSKMGQEMMKLYQQEGINPAAQMPLTCLPMMLQMPIWGALWAALNFTVEMRHEGFILWIHDLTAPDALLAFEPFQIPLLSGMIGPISSLNLLPPLLGIGMWLQQRLMPKPAAVTKQGGKSQDQLAQQRIMMTFMSVFMVVIFYNAPSGLTLYIMASNFFGLVEQYFIRKHIREEDQAAQHRPSKPGEPNARTLKKPRFLERLEKLAEEARKRQ